MASLMPNGKQQYFDANGDPLSGGKVYTYDAGTSTPRETYTDSGAGTPHTNPVVLDSRGEATIFWSGAYKAVIKDSADVTIWTVDGIQDIASLLESSSGADMIGFIQAGSGAIARTAQDKMRESVTVLDYGAVGDGVADDTDAIKSAIDYLASIGGGTVMFPPGTYLVSNSNATPTGWDDKVCIWVLDDNIHLRGAGVGATKIKMADDANAHVVAFGQRTGGTVTVANCSISHMEIDGNRGAQSAVPSGGNNHFIGVCIQSGSSEIDISHMYIHDCVWYAMGGQRDGIFNCSVRHCYLSNTGTDSIDWKNDSDDAYGNLIDHVYADNWGLLEDAISGDPSAAFDLRTGITATNLVARTPGVNAQCGIRLQNGSPAATPVQATKVSNYYVQGASVAATQGVRVISRDAEISNGKAIDWIDGHSISNPDVRCSNLISNSNQTGFRYWQDTAGSVESDTNCMVGLVARNNSQAGIICDSVDEITFVGADVRNNGIGYDIRAGCSGIRIIGGSATGNTTDISDAGTSTRVLQVSGFKTENAGSASVAIDSTGTKSFSIAHGLPVTPSSNDVTLTLKRSTNVGDWSSGFLWVTSCDATNINGQLRVLTASATGGAVVDVVAGVKALAR